jgi:predicted RNA-binding Zn-ribbon protein involved in translation (DUF1610 family)
VVTTKEPESIGECVYFTNRTTGTGKIKAWVYRIDCPQCGKVLSRAKEFMCPECGYTEKKEEHEPKLTVEVKYTCPHCGNSGMTTTEYKRMTFEGKPSYVFTCQKCQKKIGISKKMK